MGGHKRSEEHLSNLLNDLTAIVDGQSQAGTQFRTNRLYTRLTAAEMHRQLIAQYGCDDDEPPTTEPNATKLNKSGYYPQKAAKNQQQKLPETDAIFGQLKQNNEEADADELTLRISRQWSLRLQSRQCSSRETHPELMQKHTHLTRLSSSTAMPLTVAVASVQERQLRMLAAETTRRLP